MKLLDVARGDDSHTAERLATEPIIWLTTVRADGRPHNVPVWFAWNDPAMLVFSMPRTAKMADIRRSQLVSLALDSADAGQDIVVADAHAELADSTDPRVSLLTETFREKYSGFTGDTSFEQWRTTFSQPLLLHVERIIAWRRTTQGLAYRVVP